MSELKPTAARPRLALPLERACAGEDRSRGLVVDVARDTGLDDAAFAAIGVGVEMPESVTTRAADGSRGAVPLVKNSNTTCLHGQPFRTDLERALGKADVAVAPRRRHGRTRSVVASRAWTRNATVRIQFVDRSRRVYAAS